MHHDENAWPSKGWTVLLFWLQVGRLREMQEMGLDVEALQDNGILIDTESDESKEVDQQEESSEQKHR